VRTGQQIEINDPILFNSPVTFSELPERPIDTAQATATTLSALNTERIALTNTGAVTVTDFTEGQDGQELVLLGDGFTTVTHGTNIFTNTAASKLLAANAVYHFVQFNGNWYETAGSGTTLTAGAGISVSGSTITNRYVGKSVCLYAAEVVITTTGTTSPFPNNSRKCVAVVDTTNMGQYRISITGSSAGGGGIISPAISYSTNGSSWTDDSLLAGMEFNSTPECIVSAWDTLPATNATHYVTVVYQCSVENVTVYTVHLEFKP
jgi:hypothetical protein